VGQRPVEDDCVVSHAEAIESRPWDEATVDGSSPFSALFQSRRCHAIPALRSQGAEPHHEYQPDGLDASSHTLSARKPMTSVVGS
jgi:hypothetical protein